MENQNKNLLPQTINYLVIDSGNLLTVEEIKRKASILPTEEVIKELTIVLKLMQFYEQFVEGMNQIVNQWQQNGNLKTQSTTAFLTNVHQNSSASIASEERQTLRITVKLFLFDDCEPDCPSLVNGVDIVLKQLNIETIDSLIISLPNKETKLTLDDIKPFWKCAENVVEKGKALQLGISDLDTTQLEQLYEWAQKYKPMTNHVNLDACCVIPPEMSTFAKQNNIQLLTHNDPKEFLPEDRFHQILSQLVSDSKQWKRGWIARYSIIVVGKGILQTKGFILSAKK